MASYMLQANPKAYNLPLALHDGKGTIQWGIKTHQRLIVEGDEIFFWISGPEGGLAASGRVSVGPKPESEITVEEDKYWVDRNVLPIRRAPFYVTVLIEKVAKPILPRDRVKSNPFLKGLEIFSFANATCFTVTAEQAQEMRGLISGEKPDDRLRRILGEYKPAAKDWIDSKQEPKDYFAFFERFKRKEFLEKAEWSDFQKLGQNIHAFQSMGIARGKALGNPNHDLRHYREVFLALFCDEKTPLRERIRRFYEDEKYALKFFKDACFEIVGQCFSNEFFIKNSRSIDALEILGISLEKIRGESNVDYYFRFNEVMNGLLKVYLDVVGRQSALPPRIELDQFVYYLTEKGKAAGNGANTDDDEIQSPESDRRYWVFAPGEGAENFGEQWDQGIIAYGADKLGDFNQYPDKPSVRKALLKAYPENGSQTQVAFMVHAFHLVLKPGDVIFVKRGRKVLLGYGIVSGSYEFRDSRSSLKNVRAMLWKKRGEWPLEDMFALKTLTNVSAFPEFIQKLFSMMGVEGEASEVPKTEGEVEAEEIPYSIQDIYNESFESDENIDRAMSRLLTSKNLILQGPPGTGKTYLARQLAWALTGSKSNDQVTVVQFHQSYSYEDFVQGFRPNSDQKLELRKGHFLRFCTLARLEPRKKFVMVIDEINRGNLSRVFGEILSQLEVDKRGESFKVKLVYDESPEGSFYVPENLYLIGTMNTADRSLAVLDFAMRRRFAFMALEPLFDSSQFEEHLRARSVEPKTSAKIVARFKVLNESIAEDVRALGSGYRIGHSFFVQQGEGAVGNDAWYHEIVVTQIAPLLREYWFEDPKVAESHIEKLLAP